MKKRKYLVRWNKLTVQYANPRIPPHFCREWRFILEQSGCGIHTPREILLTVWVCLWSMLHEVDTFYFLFSSYCAAQLFPFPSIPSLLHCPHTQHTHYSRVGLPPSLTSRYATTSLQWPYIFNSCTRSHHSFYLRCYLNHCCNIAVRWRYKHTRYAICYLMKQNQCS